MLKEAGLKEAGLKEAGLALAALAALALLVLVGLSSDDPVDSVDCVGSWSTCDASCSKLYTVTTQQSGNGASCEADAGATETCSAGEGDCPPADEAGATETCSAGDGDCPPNVDCHGYWSNCTADCGTSTYTVTTSGTAQRSA
jgi:hypothetical protein